MLKLSIISKLETQKYVDVRCCNSGSYENSLFCFLCFPDYILTIEKNSKISYINRKSDMGSDGCSAVKSDFNILCQNEA